MTEERRYSEQEVTEIFEAATRERKVGQISRASADGLTLAELQTIGGEVGLAPARIAEEAAALAVRRDAVVRETRLGMPISVGRSVDLERAPTDREWETLVAELREIFGAQGKVAIHGSLREWRNGNLHASVEPTATGHRLRLGTRKGNVTQLGIMGMTGVLMGLFFLMAGLAKGDIARVIPFAAFFAGLGGVAWISTILSLPRWARKREEQMAYIADRAQALIKSGTREED